MPSSESAAGSKKNHSRLRETASTLVPELLRSSVSCSSDSELEISTICSRRELVMGGGQLGRVSVGMNVYMESSPWSLSTGWRNLVVSPPVWGAPLVIDMQAGREKTLVEGKEIPYRRVSCYK